MINVVTIIEEIGAPVAIIDAAIYWALPLKTKSDIKKIKNKFTPDAFNKIPPTKPIGT